MTYQEMVDDVVYLAGVLSWTANEVQAWVEEVAPLENTGATFSQDDSEELLELFLEDALTW